MLRSNKLSTYFFLKFQSLVVSSKFHVHNVPLTSTTYPVKRKIGNGVQYFESKEGKQKKYFLYRGKFGKLTNSDEKFFSEIIGASHVMSDLHDIEAYNIDWIRTVRGQSKLLLKPKSTSEVSSVLKYCNERKLAVCPQGGNTGLVGGSVPVFDEIILSTDRMNEILSVDPIAGVLVCQAGCILERANERLERDKLMVPLDLGSKGSCHLGGNISTNAGGLRLLRYGSLRGTVLGVEAVLADGTILDCLSTLRKDNTGFDIKQLMIGSEGTLGVVTALSILCPQKPASVNVAFLGTETFEDLLVLLREARLCLGEILSAVEFMDSEAMRLVTTYLNLSNPINDHPFYMLIEISGSNSGHDEEKLNAFLQKIMEKSWAKDGTVATDVTKMKAIWALRERIAEAILHDGYNFKYDMSLPTKEMYNLVTATRKHLKGKCKTVTGYGHLGDGNVHLNVSCEQFNDDIYSAIEPFVYEWTSKYKGSISAEHGLGFKKKNYIGYSKNKEAVFLMQKLKNLFDPNKILNPYKTLPDSDVT